MYDGNRETQDRVDADIDDEAGAGPRGLTRRSFVNGLGLVTAGGLLAACSGDDDGGDMATPDDTDPEASATTGDADLDTALQASDLPEIEWDMATSWPPSVRMMRTLP